MYAKSSAFGFVFEGKLDEIQALNLDSKTIQGLRDQRHNNSPLIYTAARQGHDAIVSWFIEVHNVDVNAAQATGSTALHAAAYHGHLQVCEVIFN